MSDGYRGRRFPSACWSICRRHGVTSHPASSLPALAGIQPGTAITESFHDAWFVLAFNQPVSFLHLMPSAPRPSSMGTLKPPPVPVKLPRPLSLAEAFGLSLDRCAVAPDCGGFVRVCHQAAMGAAGKTKRRNHTMSDSKQTETTTESPEPHRLPGTRPRGTERLLDPNRQRMATRRRQGIQHPARRCAARRPDHAPRRHRKERLTQPGGPQCPPTT